MSADLDVAVVGAGIAGLAVAKRLRAQGRNVHVFEAADHVGGRMASVRQDGYVADTGAEMIGTTGYPATWRLVEELGIARADVPLIDAPLAMWRDGRAHPHVGDPRGFLTGAGLRPSARWRLVRLLANAGRRDYSTDHPEATPLGDRAVADVIGGDLHDYLFQPLSGGFYGWDTTRAAAGPLLAHMLAVGATKTFRTYRDGMDTVARALAEHTDVSTGVTVREVVTTGSGARLVADSTPLTARTVVLAVPAPVAAELHADAPEYVRRVEFRSMIKVCCLLDRPLDAIGAAFGLAIPAVENPILAGVVLDERKHPSRVPDGRGMATLVAGQEVVTDLVGESDDEIARTLVAQAEPYLPGLAHALRGTVVARHRHGLPMPTAEALAVRKDFVDRPPAAVEYAGDWYALRPCSESAVRSAEVVAERLADAGVPAVARG
ncbi:NAD(P)/FAD-dependent oxidoreductase [Actinokineospora auranticolor]|uniref:Oxygen-dependent protoporphyrinogen oxidase n=1 Tax=Actinokineospora auranticolor TaxID=155976 RepID=A0A2S6GFS2_9PSEU|nr:NAD(P)/FAD-dependent oxidoreductase [Actinokineospora auranticolor]PPK64073.1 oxygen-dependent protoporphyrinogen oxidase [Actinokineospora auranticolor]